MKKAVVASLIGLVVMAGFSTAAPTPAVVQKSGLWTAKVAYEPLRPYLYQAATNQPPQRYWYTILTIENPTRRDVQVYPKADLVTDTVQVIPVGQNVPTAVVGEILASHRQGKYPLLKSWWAFQNELAGSNNLLRVGSDYAVDVLLVWPEIDPQAAEVRLYITGLSNETAAIDLPTSGRQAFLRKTLEMSYDLKSDPRQRRIVDAVFKSSQWIMR